MKFLRGWVNGIIIAIIINTIIELIIPEGKNKKYVRSIMGIYITFVIVSPIFSKLTNKTFNFEGLINKYNVESYATVETNIDTNAYIEDTYISKIKEDIKEKLKLKGYDTKNITVVIERENNNYGEILNLVLEIDKAKNTIVERIEKVDINLENKLNKEKSEITEEEKSKLKEYLNGIYGIEYENIKIY